MSDGGEAAAGRCHRCQDRYRCCQLDESDHGFDLTVILILLILKHSFEDYECDVFDLPGLLCSCLLLCYQMDESSDAS